MRAPRRSSPLSKYFQAPATQGTQGSRNMFTDSRTIVGKGIPEVLYTQRLSATSPSRIWMLDTYNTNFLRKGLFFMFLEVAGQQGRASRVWG